MSEFGTNAARLNYGARLGAQRVSASEVHTVRPWRRVAPPAPTFVVHVGNSDASDREAHLVCFHRYD
jgi:hypothetical protein